MREESEPGPLPEALEGDFVAVNLGCAGDPDPPLPKAWKAALTVVEVDAAEPSRTTSRFHRRIALREPVAGKAGRYRFTRNTFSGSSSLLPPRGGMVEAYGMERYHKPAETVEVECRTLPELLEENGIHRVDLLKTDLEGLDFEILRSMVPAFGEILALQMELRFEPFYEGEPQFHEVVGFLAENGFELLDLEVERWKYKTRHRRWQLQGRAAWADVTFLLAAERIAEDPRLLAKQIALARLLGKSNVAEFLLERHGAELPPGWRRDLESLIRSRSWSLARGRQALRRWARPALLWLKHRIRRSEHVALR